MTTTEPTTVAPPIEKWMVDAADAYMVEKNNGRHGRHVLAGIVARHAPKPEYELTNHMQSQLNRLLAENAQLRAALEALLNVSQPLDLKLMAENALTPPPVGSSA